jgi:uncharacterized protein (TIGR03437 family)
MGRWVCIAILGSFLGPALVAQPYINYRGVVNAASYAPPGVPAGSIARGSVFAVFGRGLGPAQFTQVSQFPIQIQLAGVSLRITQGNTALDAYPIFVSAGQLGAILPSNTPLGKVALRVSYNGQQSNPAVIDVVPSAVGLFAMNSGGFGPGSVQNFVSATEMPVNSTRFTARPGQVVVLWGTGLGAIKAADNILPPVGDLPGPIDVFVGGKLASKQYAGRSGCCAGIDQIVFTVPADVPSGCYVPVQVRTPGALVSNAVTIAIEGNGNPCTDAFNPAANALRAASRRGLVMVERVDSIIDQDVQAAETVTLDSFAARFSEGQPSETWFSKTISLPPPGACTFYTGVLERLATTVTSLGARPLDVGAALTLMGAGPAVQMPREESQAGAFSALLGVAPAQANLPGLYLAPQRYTLRAPGGADLAGFETSVEVNAPVTWTNRAATNTIGPQNPFTVRWAGGTTADLILIMGESRNTAANSVGRFVCTAEPGAGLFTVPSYVLAALPPTPEFTVSRSAAVSVGALSVRSPVRMVVPTLDAGYMLTGSYQKKDVVVQ